MEITCAVDEIRGLTANEIKTILESNLVSVRLTKREV